MTSRRVLYESFFILAYLRSPERLCSAAEVHVACVQCGRGTRRQSRSGELWRFMFLGLGCVRAECSVLRVASKLIYMCVHVGIHTSYMYCTIRHPYVHCVAVLAQFEYYAMYFGDGIFCRFVDSDVAQLVTRYATQHNETKPQRGKLWSWGRVWITISP